MNLIELHVDNVYVEVKYANNNIEFQIWDKLSFEIQEYNSLTVPQVRHLFNRITKKSYTGLLDYIIEILKENNEEYKIVDKRIAWQPNADYALVKYLDKEHTQELKVRDYQQNIINNCRPRDIIQAATSSGKMLPLDTNILTPTGWKLLKDIHPGSIIYDEDGLSTKVTDETSIKIVDEYEIVFKDNVKIRCCKDHLWKYINIINNFDINKFKVATTKELLQQNIISSGRHYKFALPINKPIQFEKKDLLIPPYLLGFLLGNGHFGKNIEFNNTEDDLVNKIKQLVINNKLGEFITSKKYPAKHRYKNSDITKLKQYINNTFGHCLVANKFIPQEYLLSSIDDRLELARGLIDTNGYIDKSGHIQWRTVSKQLNNDFIFLIRSLGYRTSVHIRDKFNGNKSYIIRIWSNDDKLFSSNKHKIKYANRKLHKNHHYDVLKIVDIKKLNTKTEMKCITVDSPKHTYICQDFIVTHNTLMMAGLIAKFQVKPVSIFADKISLCTQLRSEFEKFLGEPIGLVGGGIRDIQDITVFSAQSATEEMVKDTKLLLFDECHHLPCNTLNDIGQWCINAYYRVGVSATPWRSDNSGLLIDAICNRPRKELKVTASELIQQGYITPCDIFWVKHQQIFQQRNYNELYQAAIVLNRNRNLDIIKIAYNMRKVKDATILILVQRIEHGEIILNLIQQYITDKTFMLNSSKTGSKKIIPVKVGEAEFLSGSDNSLKRNATIQAFRNKQCKILICTTIADEGLDIPSADCLILAGGGKSSTRALQRIGRVLRKYEGKDRAFVYDFRDSTPMLLRQARVRNNLYKQEPAFNIKNFPMQLLNFNLSPINK